MDDTTMFDYNRELKCFSRKLRTHMTDAEAALWFHLRKRQVLNVQFYRQRPFLNYILDFYAHLPRLAIECDGSQHFEEGHAQNDKERDEHLNQLGILVLRFDNAQILNAISSVMEVIWENVKKRIEVK